MASDPAGRHALIVDWGGVMTTDLFGSFRRFCAEEGLDFAQLGARLRDTERRLVRALETGELPEPEFERAFAARLGVAAEGLIDRLFAGSRPDDEMQSAVLHARAAGIATGLLSNSWGTGRYPRARLAELFDAVTISGEVGLRKPAPEIYVLAAERLGTDPSDCVYVDDIAANLPPAAELGMATVHHVHAPDTIVELERLLDTPLR